MRGVRRVGRGGAARGASPPGEEARPPERAQAGPALAILEALGRSEETPTVLLTDAEAQTDRVAAARAGVDGFLPRQLEPTAIADAVAEHVRAVPVERVLACDDDPAVLETVTAVLEQSGLVADTVDDPRRFWDVLADAPPDLALLDIDMPHVDGLELCRTLRQDPAHASRPVVFLTGHANRDSVQAAFDAGADDLVAKPVVAAELDARVRNRLERSRLLRRLAENDALTDLLNRRASLGALERLVALARRHEQPLCLAVLDIDRFREVNDLHGHAAGDAVLRELGRALRTRFRAGDVLARWGGDELVVGMYGMGRHDGVQRLAEVLEDLRETSFHGDAATFTVSFSGGAAERPVDADDVSGLYRSADRALRLAKRLGGDRVQAAPRENEQLPGLRDVVVVEDDAPLSGMLEHALTTRGYETEVLDDGGEAHRRLVGEEADLHPRVLLLDVDLPALNGLDLLGALGRHGVLDRTSVVMLTGRAGEEEVLEALRLGAVDHVSKPFSVPVLLERVRRALSG